MLSYNIKMTRNKSTQVINNIKKRVYKIVKYGLDQYIYIRLGWLVKVLLK